MDQKQYRHAKAIVKSHYNLNREPTQSEVKAEIANLKRKMPEYGGIGFDDSQLLLHSRLSNGQHPIDWSKV